MPAPSEAAATALTGAARAIWDAGVALSRFTSDLERMRRSSAEAGAASAERDCRHLLDALNETRTTLVACRNDVVSARDALRSTNPELTPIRPPSGHFRAATDELREARELVDREEPTKL